MRNIIEAREINMLRGIPGTENISYALRKRNLELCQKWNELYTNRLMNLKLYNE